MSRLYTGISYKILVYYDNLLEAYFFIKVIQIKYLKKNSYFVPISCCDSHLHVNIFDYTSEFRLLQK